MKSTTLEDVLVIHGLFGALSAILTFFVTIAGVVAFFSIVNTLFMAVSERKREIGVLQAIGATRGYVAAMFAAEAGAIGLMGGLIGYLLGKVLCIVETYMQPKACHMFREEIGVIFLEYLTFL